MSNARITMLEQLALDLRELELLREIIRDRYSIFTAADAVDHSRLSTTERLRILLGAWDLAVTELRKAEDKLRAIHRSETRTIVTAPCDGEHASPRCADPKCWQCLPPCGASGSPSHTGSTCVRLPGHQLHGLRHRDDEGAEWT